MSTPLQVLSDSSGTMDHMGKTQRNRIIEEVDLDLAMARTLLDKNIQNRPFTRGLIEKIAQDIVDGRWFDTGDTIKVTWDGHLLDGQHRCAALIRANDPVVGGIPGTTIRVVIVRGVELEAQDHMDIGKKRSVADQLAMRGLINCTNVAAAARLIVLHDNSVSSSPKDERLASAHLRVLEWVDNHPEISDHASHTGLMYGNSSKIPGSALTAAAWLIDRVSSDEEAQEEFFHSLRTGADLPEDSPILSLRNRVSKANLSNEYLTNRVMMVLVLRTWNAYRTGAQLEKFPIRSRGKLVRITRIEP